MGKKSRVKMNPMSLSALLAATLPSGPVLGGGVDRPNIVLIIGDDMSPDFSCYGGPARTPNIDRLAAGGMRFENAYVTASSCSPSRHSILSGRYPHNTGSSELHLHSESEQFMFPLALRNAGYYTVQAGKWHLGNQSYQAFDQTYATSYAEDPTGAEHWVQSLQERPLDKPFFMWFAAFDAHRGWEPDPESPPVDPDSLELPVGIPDTPAGRRDLASYYVEIQRFDRYVGKVVDELKRQGVFDDTLILLLGDNGRPFPRCKTSLYDDGMKTPLIVHWPNGPVAGGSVTESLVCTIDLAPTLLLAAGLPVPEAVQGVSLFPVLKNPGASVRDFIFGERNWHVQRACGRMVRWKDYVYIRDFTPGDFSFQINDSKYGSYAELLRLKEEGKLTPVQAEIFSTNRTEELLFRVSADPQQVQNLAENPEHKAVLDYLRRTLGQWQEETGDSIPDVDQMTPHRYDQETFERIYPGSRPPTGVIAGQEAGATEINHPGPQREEDVF